MRRQLQPSLQEIERLSRLVPGYPVHRDELLWTGRAAKLSNTTLRLVTLFSEERVFESPDDVISDLQTLAFMLIQEKTMRPEKPASPQD